MIKSKKIEKKEVETSQPVSKKELAVLKAAYKKGKLKFNSSEIAEAILDEFKQNIKE